MFVMVMVVVVELRVESKSLLMSGQVRLYPLMIPFCSSGGPHSSVTLCEKNVVLKQLIGGEGTVEGGRRRRRTMIN